MILHTFNEGRKSATVSFSQGEYLVMKYIDNNFIEDEVSLTENDAEIKAEDWVLSE